jgi:hypothetical protein
MVSEYEYITITDLENYFGKDLGNLYLYSDSNLDAIITQAERLVNSIVGTTFTSEIIDDAIISATLEISSNLINNKMISDAKIKKESGLTHKTMKEIIDDAKSILQAKIDEYNQQRSMYIE